MNIFKTQSKLELSFWLKELRVILQLTPALPDAKGVPKAGQQKYDYKKKVTISFKEAEMYIFAHKLLQLADGKAIEYKSYADLSKSEAEGDDKKSLRVAQYQDKISINLTKNEEKCNMIIDSSECFAMARWIIAHADYAHISQTLKLEDRSES